jgi:hypothetical protein
MGEGLARPSLTHRKRASGPHTGLAAYPGAEGTPPAGEPPVPLQPAPR